MSYCRWSEGDVYAYSDITGGWTTHVGAKRIVGELPQSDYLKNAEYRPIGLAYDGMTFRDATLAEFRDRLLALREAGYVVPDRALERVEREMEEPGDAG